MNEIIPYLPGLSPVENKELCARFDGGRLSSDGGVLLLRGIEQRLGLAALLAGCLADARDPASTTHTYADMIAARLFAIACGYEDCDDLDVLRFDRTGRLDSAAPRVASAQRQAVLGSTPATGARSCGFGPVCVASMRVAVPGWRVICSPPRGVRGYGGLDGAGSGSGVGVAA